MLTVACSSEPSETIHDGVLRQIPPLDAVRGVVLISLDTLRADRLGLYGYQRDTSPFLDRLAAERGIVFERTISQYPGTLISHMSMLTGLYPREHGVLPPASILPSNVPLLAELLAERGFRTAGHTEGGFMDGDFGFKRGFEEFTDTSYSQDQDIERTLSRGVDFLQRLGEQDRFFLFLHSYSVHDPYLPPSGFGVNADLVPEPAPTGETIKEFNRGFLSVADSTIADYSDRYDASIRYADQVVSNFFSRLEELGLAEDTAVIITSDHGEAFAEHGRLGHEQTYPEELWVPLIVVHPGVERGVRIDGLAELIDLPPTILEMLDLEADWEVSGRDLITTQSGGRAHSETSDPARQQVLFRQDGEQLWMLVDTEYLSDPDGSWLPLDNSIDVDTPAELELVSFAGPKEAAVWVDGHLEQRSAVGGGWSALEIAGEGRKRVRLRSESCTSPQRLGVGGDPRCLSLKMRGRPAKRLELFELSGDPTASEDRSYQDGQRLRRLVGELGSWEFELRGTSKSLELDPETRRTLESLGYL